MNCDDDLLRLLSKNEENKSKMWEGYFERYSREFPDEPSYTVNDICKILQHKNGENSDRSLKKSELIQIIENELKSDLRKLILEREKANIFNDAESYHTVHHQLKVEINKLTKYLTKSDVKRYICLCLQPNKKKAHFIEKVLKSQLKSLVLKQRNSLFSKDFPKWNAKLLKEWKHVSDIFSEDDVIIYTLNILKHVNNTQGLESPK